MRALPNTMEELVETVNEFTDSLEREEVRKAVGNIVKRAESCIEAEGGAFEYKLKSKRNRVDSFFTRRNVY